MSLVASLTLDLCETKRYCKGMELTGTHRPIWAYPSNCDRPWDISSLNRVV